jgi:hypothetical protein
MTRKKTADAPATAGELAETVSTLLEHWFRQNRHRAKVTFTGINNAQETDLELSVEYGDIERPNTYTAFTVRVQGPLEEEYAV